ncbi:hypothetical protein SAMN02799624_05323 [Paenibacillus sp. UNC496MF]|uniref:hypothetical protein n=1 Tax=Paenibacillus sp. UNC496MF TaxID=1502753 RepID=UPI0008DF61F8|nr:hypothetical protein [Paenibacillus sp. UNC496MF]SFJ64146.1 hypothetical protein SAMN02799624_05323 [Paenibacillus sp. UNC496MF]
MAVTMEEVLRGVPAKHMINELPFRLVKGQAVALENGDYSHQDEVYIVEDGVVSDIYKNVEGQLEFQLEGI